MKSITQRFTQLFFSSLFILCLHAGTKAQSMVDFSYTVSGATVTFTNLSTGCYDPSFYPPHNWEFGDSNVSGVFNPVHTYTVSGTYNCCYASENHPAACGYASICHPVTIIVSGIDEAQAINGSVRNFPNPFSGTTTVDYVLNEPGSLDISVYDESGKKVATIKNSEMESVGNYEIPFDGSALAEGFYFLRLTLNGRSVTEKMVLAK